MSTAGKSAKKKADKSDKNQKKEEAPVEEFEECVGEGKFVYPNKAVYIGQYKQLKTGQKIKEGKGKLYMPGSKILNQKGKENKNQNTEELIGCEYYDGEWKDDKMDGYGTYLYSNGDKYEGYWSMGSQNGKGKYIFTDGRSYEGEWKMQKMHGTGFFSCLDKYANFNGEFREGKFITKNQEELKEEKRLIKIYEALCFGLGYLTAFIWGGLQLRSGAITIGVMTSFLQLVSQIQQPILALLNLVPQFIHATASIDRLDELDTIQLESEKGDIPLPPLQKPGIKFQNVTFRYTDEGGDVLKNFTRNIPPCSRTAIVGRTGAGKTTVFRMLLGLITPQEGSVSLYDDTNDNIAVSPATRQNFVFVPQGNTLMSGTIRYNLCLANPDATDAQLKDALHIAAADFVMDFPDGLDTVIAERGSGLSEGQAQRIAIARGILRDGSIMLLDEISSSLDENTERELFTRLFARCKDKTILMITHRPAVAELCDAVWRV